VFEKIISDESIKTDPAFVELRTFCKWIVKKFLQTAKKNPYACSTCQLYSASMLTLSSHLYCAGWTASSPPFPTHRLVFIEALFWKSINDAEAIKDPAKDPRAGRARKAGKAGAAASGDEEEDNVLNAGGPAAVPAAAGQGVQDDDQEEVRERPVCISLQHSMC